jgi:hypothetical protein
MDSGMTPAWYRPPTNVTPVGPVERTLKAFKAFAMRFQQRLAYGYYSLMNRMAEPGISKTTQKSQQQLMKQYNKLVDRFDASSAVSGIQRKLSSRASTPPNRLEG